MTVNFELDPPEALSEMQDKEGKVAYTAAHAQHVEWDTEYSSLDVNTIFGFIRPWVDRKWNDLSSGLKAAAIEGRDDVSEESHKDAVTGMISHSIKDTGIEGVFYGQRSVEFAKQQANAVASTVEGSNNPEAAEVVIAELLNLSFAKSQEIIGEEATDRGTLLQSGQVVPPGDG